MKKVAADRSRPGTQTAAPDWPYKDIADLPHHVSKTHPRMDMIRRAAQFAPFAALKGYEEAILDAADSQFALLQADPHTEKK